MILRRFLRTAEGPKPLINSVFVQLQSLRLPHLNCPQCKYETLRFPSQLTFLYAQTVGLHLWWLEAGLPPCQMPFSLKTGFFVSAAISWQIERQAGRYSSLLCTPACFWHSGIIPLSLSLSDFQGTLDVQMYRTPVMRPAQLCCRRGKL